MARRSHGYRRLRLGLRGLACVRTFRTLGAARTGKGFDGLRVRGNGGLECRGRSGIRGDAKLVRAGTDRVINRFKWHLGNSDALLREVRDPRSGVVWSPTDAQIAGPMPILATRGVLLFRACFHLQWAHWACLHLLHLGPAVTCTAPGGPPCPPRPAPLRRRVGIRSSGLGRATGRGGTRCPRDFARDGFDACSGPPAQPAQGPLSASKETGLVGER
mmetsp:Transcript_76440/g.205831  ORF Transcript_76440/g.205831 Transcript_76440/m.205831 type:complete len:217 (-) Transcript_76440:942-1592(-)